MSYESKLLEHLKLTKDIEIPNTFKICDKCGATYPSHHYDSCERCHNDKLREESKIIEDQK